MRYGAGRHEPSRAHATDGPRRHRNHAALCEGHTAGGLPPVCSCGVPVCPASSGKCLVSFVRQPPLQHPLASVFERAVVSLGTALSPGTTRHYRGTVRSFLPYLAADHPKVKRLDQLRREPHILGWMSRLRAQNPPLTTESYINRMLSLRSVVHHLGWIGRCGVL